MSDRPRSSSPTSGARTRATLAAVLTACALVLPATAFAKASTLADPAGDSISPGRDITQLAVDYRASGKLTVTVTTAGPFDMANEDALLTVMLKSGNCEGGASVIAYATVSELNPPLAYGRPKGSNKYKPAVGGRQEFADNNVLRITYKGKGLKNLKARCFTAWFSEASEDDPNGKRYDDLAIVSFD